MHSSKYFFLFSQALLLISVTFNTNAASNEAIKHEHDGRSHVHKLPKSGINHNHNKLKPISNTFDKNYFDRQLDFAIFNKQIGKHQIAINTLEPFAKNGIAEAEYHLYEIMLSSFRENNSDYSRINKLLESSAKKGFGMAQYVLGNRYNRGYAGYPKDYQKANYWFSEAIDKGNAGAQSSLGDSYKDGKGIRKDNELALYWYNKAANQNINKKTTNKQHLYQVRNSQADLGRFYCEGKITPQNLTKCAYWIKKAADNGLTGLQWEWDKYNLGNYL